MRESAATVEWIMNPDPAAHAAALDAAAGFPAAADSQPALALRRPAGLDGAQLNAAKTESLNSGISVLSALERITGLEARTLMRALAERFGYPCFETADLLKHSPAFDRIPLGKCLNRGVVLVRDLRGRLIGVLPDPFDAALTRWVDAQAGGGDAATAGAAGTVVSAGTAQTGGAPMPMRYALATRADLMAYLARLEESAHAFESITADAAAVGSAAGIGSEVIDFSRIAEDQSPVVRIVNSTLYDAMKQGASDIHWESTPTGLAIKFRIDGVLVDIAQVPGVEQAERIVSRIKVLSELDIAERRVPQDGSFRVSSRGRDIDIRVSVMPSIHGEDAVLRILDKAHLMASFKSLTLDALGFDAGSLKTLRRLATEPYGMLLVTGPTGSGKTTTLYGLLSELNKGRDKIITIEDPVEYQMAGILQIPVNEKKGLTFARGLRSILRHDPDIMMVGEIRDAETAEIAIQSALTGHVVLATLHANNGFDALSRFGHLGVETYSLLSALNGIWAQRLVRLNCPHCTVEYQPDAEALDNAGLTRADLGDTPLMHGQGCGDCRGTGYKGRRAIAEFVALNETLRRLITERAPVDDLRAAATQAGMRSLRDASLALVAEGRTTLEEVRRVALHA